MYSISRVKRRLGLAFLLFIGMIASVSSARADQIDLSLNLLLNDVHNPYSGGTWQLAAKSDGFGIAGVYALIEGIDTTDPLNTVFTGPSGIVNGGDNAGFVLNMALFNSSYHSLVLSQVPLGVADTEQTVFYGVGSIIDDEGGVPNYTNVGIQYPDATAIGPEYTTLTDLTNPVWGSGDPLGDTDWNHAAILAQGVFAEGVIPSFYSDTTNYSSGSIFTTLPADAGTLGAITGDDSPIEASTIVRSDFDPYDGDFNEDGVVDQMDFVVWRNNLGATVTPAGSGLDLDGSGVVDAGDYVLMQANFGAGMSTSGSFSGLSGTAVPEPQSAGLTLVFMVVFGIVASFACGRQYRSRRFSLIFLNNGETA